MTDPKDQPFACSGECSRCSGERGDRMPQCAVGASLAGWSLALAAVSAFVLPLVLAATAAGLVAHYATAPGREAWMTLAALGGVGLGAWPAARVVGRLGARAEKENA